MMAVLTGAPRALLVAAALWVVVIGATGVVVTRLDAWYYGLTQPSWKPSDVLFGPVWTTIFLCAGYAFVAAWQAPGSSRGLLVAAYTLNTVLNVLWSALFFRLHRPDWAFVEVWVLLGSIAGMMVAVYVPGGTAGWLLVPYFAWVSFAACLNRAIVVLNRPFGVR